MTTGVSRNPTAVPRRRFIRAVLRGGIQLALGALTNLRVVGRENLPAAGPLVVVANHFNFLDPLALIRSLPYPLEFIGGVQAPNAPPALSWIRILYGIMAVRRGSSSRDALTQAQSFLSGGGVLVIFPEGGSWASVLRPPRPGAALLAARSGARILPVALDGWVDVFPSLGKRKRAQTSVTIGQPFGPFQMGSVRDRSSRQQVDEVGHEMMRQIAALLPTNRRGCYSDDPAIRAAAKGTEIYPWENQIE